MLSTNLTMCSQIYNAFSKFMASQVVSKAKSVNTHIIGIFAPGVTFWPSPEFLKASKLKQVGPTTADLSIETYGELYENQAKADPKPVDLNFGSIALVCSNGVKTEHAFRVLKEIFSHIANCSSDTSFNIAIRGLGKLKIN